MLDPGAIAVHRLVVAEAGRVPELGQAFFEHGPKRGIEALGGHLAHLHDARVIEIEAPLLAASQLYQAMLGSLQMRLLVNAKPAPTEAEIEAAIAAAFGPCNWSRYSSRPCGFCAVRSSRRTVTS